jgi:hypothetical protein
MMFKPENVFNDPTNLEIGKVWITMSEQNDCFSKCMKENYEDVQDCDECKEKGNTKEQAEEYCKKHCGGENNGKSEQ